MTGITLHGSLTLDILSKTSNGHGKPGDTLRADCVAQSDARGHSQARGRAEPDRADAGGGQTRAAGIDDRT